MGTEELFAKARAIIGEGEKGDYLIAPTEHAELLSKSAPALARVLRREKLQTTLAGQYQEKDQEAIEAQTDFKKTASRANAAVFWASCFSALVLVAAPLLANWPSEYGKWTNMGLGICGLVAAGLGSFWLNVLQGGKLLERWMTARAAAETYRVQYFEAVVAPAEDDAQAAVPLLLLQLEYFRRYQFDVQRAFYKERGAQLRRTATSLLAVAAAAIAFASVATGLGGILGGALGPQFAGIAALAVVATALSSYVSARESMSQARRNAERYAKTRDALEALAGRLDEVRETAAANQRKPLEEFVAAVHEQTSLEHRQWLEAGKEISDLVTKLDDALAQAQKKPAPKPGAPAAADKPAAG